MRDALEAAGADAVDVYHDLAFGLRDGRPGLDSCRRSLRKGGVSVVWKLDRLDRNLRHLVDTAQDLSARGVGLGVLVGDGAQADSTTAAGRLVFGIFAAPTGLERELIRERTVAGLEAARRGQGRGSGGRRLGPGCGAPRDTLLDEQPGVASLGERGRGVPLFRLARCLVNLPADGVRLRSGLRSHEPPSGRRGCGTPGDDVGGAEERELAERLVDLGDGGGSEAVARTRGGPSHDGVDAGTDAVLVPSAERKSPA